MELMVIWNGEEIKADECKARIKEVGKELLDQVFSKYKDARLTSKKTPIQKLTASYDAVKVSNPSGDGQAILNQVGEIEDAKRYVEYVDECLIRLPGMYKTIIIEDYVRGRDDINVYVELGLPKSTYYYMKADAVTTLVNEFIFKGIK